MKKVAVFGKPGSGKSTVSKALASATNLPLHQLDSLVYKPSGELVDKEVFKDIHDKIINSETWILDGLGPISLFYQRLEEADTLVYIDLPYSVSYWFVTKRLLKGLFVKPEGWPDGSSIFKGTLQSYKILKLCPKFWNDDFMLKVLGKSPEKEVHVIKTVAELNDFVLKCMMKEHR
ncbi:MULTISPECIES: adenylate kinase [Vibrio]|uniref:adenylate kinase n=1 Tax=Vibrio TaxID=662 RepID=UPI0002EF6D58|nr:MULTISPECIES: adenylate kinase [Vibrio]KNH12748.1 adenylate kinase [Vibrio lentus]NOI36652.1 adenylate kinase [Vibrio cyclitrophicus]OED70010.1 adenylate kinase [Vibrio cyclitrophicus ZF99]OED79928.1 adenylate kinase [Vibrio cyclitrophicus ZF65]PME16114.1 adenylate kinase [Vibrio cyclitrophicus]